MRFIIIGLLLLAGCAIEVDTEVDTAVDTEVDTVVVTEVDTVVDAVVDTEVDTDVDQSFTLTGENFRFFLNGIESPDLIVKQGDVVRIEFTSKQGLHDWLLPVFDAATKRVSDGESTFVEFVATEKGTFEYFCSVGSHRLQGMKGNFIVE